MEINVIDALYLIDICDRFKNGYEGYGALCRPRPELKLTEKFDALSKKICKEVVDVRLLQRGFDPKERAEIDSFLHSTDPDLLQKIAMYNRLDQHGRDFYEEFLERVKLRVFD